MDVASGPGEDREVTAGPAVGHSVPASSVAGAPQLRIIARIEVPLAPPLSGVGGSSAAVDVEEQPGCSISI